LPAAVLSASSRTKRKRNNQRRRFICSSQGASL
jgi:hypothetical protein